MDVLFLMNIFLLYPVLKLWFEHKSARKNLSLRACFCWDSELSSPEMDTNFRFGGTNGYGDSFLEFFFRHFKIYRLHAILHDAAGALRANSSKGLAYYYMTERGPNSWLFGHVTKLLFCFYVNFFLPSILSTVDFWSSMCCPVDIELADKNLIKE